MSESPLLLLFVVVVLPVSWLLWRRLGGNRGPSVQSVPEDRTTRLNLRNTGRFAAQWPVSVTTGDGVRRGVTGDVSLDGLLLRLDSPLDLGQIYPMTIGVPESRNIQIKGRVVWSISEGDYERQTVLGMGVVFTEILDEDQILLRTLGSPVE